jgi:hypothetical protein
MYISAVIDTNKEDPIEAIEKVKEELDNIIEDIKENPEKRSLETTRPKDWDSRYMYHLSVTYLYHKEAQEYAESKRQ